MKRKTWDDPLSCRIENSKNAFLLSSILHTYYFIELSIGCSLSLGRRKGISKREKRILKDFPIFNLNTFFLQFEILVFEVRILQIWCCRRRRLTDIELLVLFTSSNLCKQLFVVFYCCVIICAVLIGIDFNIKLLWALAFCNFLWRSSKKTKGEKWKIKGDNFFKFYDFFRGNC